MSIAVPGSIIDNTQNLEFATFVAGQIARTAAIFNVDEVGSVQRSAAASRLHHADGTMLAGWHDA